MSRRGLGLNANESAIEDNDAPNDGVPEPPVRRVFGRVSFDQNPVQHRPSFVARLRGIVNPDVETGQTFTQSHERPPIPSALKAPGEIPTNPLPVLSMIVLSITMLGEFLCANVSTPFLLFMVKGFGETRDEADVAFWTGILVSAFFLTQFLTSLLWATIADKHGRRIVFCVSLLGSAATCVVFGTCTSLPQAIAVRLLQGIFAGAVGVARGCVAFITDPSNEGRAYAILGFCWGLGGVAGAIIGGAFETPANKWPGIFQENSLFVRYPYLLPCVLAASITLVGSVLSCFLGRDGGPREGAIRLAPEKIVDQHPTIAEEDPLLTSPVSEQPEIHGFLESMQRRLSANIPFTGRTPAPATSDAISLRDSAIPLPSSPLGPRTRTFSRTSRADGSAYGFNPAFRKRLTSTTTYGTRRYSMSSSFGRRRGSNAGLPASATDTADLNFAQRLLMANENAVTNIADLWVAAAMNVDNEDPFLSDSETASEPEVTQDEINDQDRDTRSDLTGSVPASSPIPIQRISTGRRSSNITVQPDGGSLRRPSASQYGSPAPGRQTSFSMNQPRRFSSSMPAIFSHTGVRTPPAVLDAQQLLARMEDPPVPESLPPILESRPVSQDEVVIEPISEKMPSLSSQLPLMIIAQYGLLALHSTTHDQLFMSYLVSNYEAGGLNLNAGHFAQLIALMCLAQIAYQFYLYPNMGPPRGRFSHLAMFRIGSFLFIPAYLTVILYRAFASSKNDGKIILMTGLVLSTAVRYCAITFTYTAVSILLNYMTPPNAVGIANGIAQSIVSLARCFGPVLGGYLWSVSVQDNPSGYPLGFLAISGVCSVILALSFMIR